MSKFDKYCMGRCYDCVREVALMMELSFDEEEVTVTLSNEVIIVEDLSDLSH